MNTKNEQVAQEITRCLSSKIDIANSKTRIEIEKMIERKLNARYGKMTP
jgi:hypothetical protein